MGGHPTLLIAPTASGKTGAYTAPIAEMILAGPAPRNLLGWIVSPTRALVDDLTRRLAPPLAAMGLSVGRRTGEHREMTAPGTDIRKVLVFVQRRADAERFLRCSKDSHPLGIPYSSIMEVYREPGGKP
jgi:ATP-dependent helicase YprA (DUF1998 family)